MEFDSKYFSDFKFTKEQIIKNIDNALKDLKIAQEDRILEVKFNYTYNAFIKAGIALLSSYGKKVKSIPGHHIKIIEATAAILKDDSIDAMGNLMRSKRNTDFYDGGIDVTEKECGECLKFVSGAVEKIKKALFAQ